MDAGEHIHTTKTHPRGDDIPIGAKDFSPWHKKCRADFIAAAACSRFSAVACILSVDIGDQYEVEIDGLRRSLRDSMESLQCPLRETR